MKSNSIFLFLTSLALFSVSALSCQKFMSDFGLGAEGGTLIISGLVVDKRDSRPLEGIFVTFQCSEEDVEEVSVCTNANGYYEIECSGFSDTVKGNVLVTDQENRYLDSRRDIEVKWRGDGFDHQNNTFFLNDCNFALQIKQ